MSVTILNGSALALPLPDDSVDLIVTSPPYFGLRSYTDNGNPLTHQVGGEATPAEYVDALIAATREAVRVLKPTGSLWVNLGDKYAGSTGGGAPSSASTLRGNGHTGGGPKQAEGAGRASGRLITGAPTKSLIGLPWRYALRCIDQLGLILRAEIIWDKPNGLPESVRDRVRRSHEQWFHFTLSPRYYANVDEVREVSTSAAHHARYGKNAKIMKTGDTDAVPNPQRRLNMAPGGLNPLGKLPGSVWRIATQPLRVPAELGIDHFAAFPMEWPRRIITGWSPPGICTACGEGRRATSERDPVDPELLARRSTPKDYTVSRGEGQPGPGAGSTFGLNLTGGEYPGVRITGYACACPTPDAPTRPAVVLDPFGGTGTTALVADVLGRDGITVDLSADYCRLAAWRTADPRERARAARGAPGANGTRPAQVSTNPPTLTRGTPTVASKISDERLLSTFKRTTTELGRIDGRVKRAQATLDNIEQIKAEAQATIANADSDRAELDAQITHLRTIASNRGIDLDALLAAEASPATPGDDVAGQPAPGVPAFSQQ